MSLSPEQLEASLARRLAPAYLIAGDEPLLVQECADAVRVRATEAGFTEREVYSVERGFDWSALASSLGSLSLFASRRLVELRLRSPAAAEGGAELFARFAAAPPGDVLLLGRVPKLDQRQKKADWVQAFTRAAEFVEVWPVEAPALPAWIRARLQRAGLQADSEAVQLLAERVEGNLLAAHQEIEKLRLQYDGGELDAERVRVAVADSARYDVFKLADAALVGDLGRALRILVGLRAEGLQIPQVLWPLVREIRSLARVRWFVDRGMALPTAIAKAGVWRNRIALIQDAAGRHDGPGLRRLGRQAALVDRMAKGDLPGHAMRLSSGFGTARATNLADPWLEITDLVIRLAKPTLWAS